MDRKHALEETEGDLEAAGVLHERGQAMAQMRTARDTREGLVAAYVHPGGRMGALVELNCDTDFVARTDEFLGLARDLAMQVTGYCPRFVTVESVPPAVIEARRAELRTAVADHGRLVAEGRSVDVLLRAWLAEVVLYAQPFRDGPITVGELIARAIATTGDNIRVCRFERFELKDDPE